jgi:hypothetical protein
VVVSCEHGNEPSGFIKLELFLDYASNSELLKKSFAALSYLVPNSLFSATVVAGPFKSPF